MGNYAGLLKFLSGNKKRIGSLLILTHDYPDSDAIASAFALYYLANRFGIKSKIVYGGIINNIENRTMISLLRIPISKLKNSDFKEYKSYALVDTQPLFNNNSFPDNKHATIVIDQHLYSKRPEADFSIIDLECGATAVILAKAIFSSGIGMPKNLATALTYGIIIDTLNLYRVKRQGIFRIYMEVLANCDMKALVRIQNPPRPRMYYLIFKKALERARQVGNLVFCNLGPIDDQVYVAYIADFLLPLEGAKWSFCTGRYRDRLYVSLRTCVEGATALNMLKSVFSDSSQAGGHGTIAGGSIYMGSKAKEEKWANTEKELIKRLVASLRIKARTSINNPFE